MALPKGPITIQVSPSTYTLMIRMIQLGVTYNATNDLQLNPTNAANVQKALNDLYDALGSSNATIIAELQKLQTDGFNEANVINKAAGSEIVLTC